MARAPGSAPVRSSCVLAAIVGGSARNPDSPARAQQGDRLPEGTVTEVRIEGNATIPTEKIRAKILSRSGQPLDQQKVEADLKSLMASKWFSDVSPYYEESPPKSGKYILIFRVREMPVLRHVEFRGRKAVTLKEIEENTDLKVGNRSDPTRPGWPCDQIQRLYQEKGYELAEVKLVEGGNIGDTKVVFQIFEGPKFQINSVDFKGNVFAIRRPALEQGRQPQADPRPGGRQVPPRHARGRCPQASGVLPGAGLLRGQGHSGDPAGDEASATST